MAHPPAKRARPAPKSSSAKDPKESKAPKAGIRKLAAPRPKKTPSRPKKQPRESPVLNDSERRRSARSRKSDVKYVERDDDEDEEEMLEGVAEWEYPNENAEPEDEGSDDESVAESASSATPAPAPKKVDAPRAAVQHTDESELSELDSEGIELDEGKGDEVEEEEEEASPPPAKANGKRANARPSARKASASKARPSPRNGKPAASKAAPPAPGRATRLTRRTKTKSDEFAMDESDD